MTDFDDVLKEREALLLRLLAALDHLPREQQFSILTSFMRIARDKLEEETCFDDRDPLKKIELFSDAADDIGNILVALGDTAADDIASSILGILEAK